MRVHTAFSRMLEPRWIETLRLPGGPVVDVSFGAEGDRERPLRRRRRVCSRCGQTGRQLEIHDRRVKRCATWISAPTAV